jgi:hypothetical protein
VNGNRLFGLIVAVLVVAVVLVGWLLGISPVVSQIAQANIERQNVEVLNQSHQAQLDLLKVQYEDMPQLAKQLQTLQKSIPGSLASDDFVDELQTIATRTGVAITSVTLGEAVLYGTSADGTVAPPTPEPEPTDDADAPAEGPDATPEPSDATVDTSSGQTVTPGAALDGKFFTLPVSVGVHGPASAVSAFIALCQDSERLFLLTQWGITGYSTETATGTITGHTFVVRDPAAAALEAVGSDDSAEAETTDENPTPTETPAP